nr:hypothetical protein [Tanacetum cinerariifolium]
IFHVVVNKVNVDYASHLWWDFIRCIQQKKEVIHYPRFTKIIISDIIEKYKSVPKILQEEYHVNKDDTPLVSVYTTGKVTMKGMLIPDNLITDAIRDTQKVRYPSGSRCRVFLGKIQQVVVEDVEKIVESIDEESYASKFADSVFLDEEDSELTVAKTNDLIKEFIPRKERVHEFQLGIESYHIKINLTVPTLIFLGIKAKDPYSIVDEPRLCLIYLNNKEEKRVMDLVEIVKFYDATLERVLKEVKLKIFETEFMKKAPLLGDFDLKIIKTYEREIMKRLRHREQMRRWELFMNGRPILPTMRRQF